MTEVEKTNYTPLVLGGNDGDGGPYRWTLSVEMSGHVHTTGDVNWGEVVEALKHAIAASPSTRTDPQ